MAASPLLAALRGSSSPQVAGSMVAARSLAAAWTERHGSLRGRPVLISGEPRLGWARSFLALLEAGAIAVPVPMGAPARELAHFASDAGATLAVVTHPGEVPFPAGVEVVRVDEMPSAVDAGAAAREAAGRAPPASDGANDGEGPRADDVALILYTSGTTGAPKGAAITHAALAVQAENLRRTWGFVATDVLVHALPMHHLHGIVVALLTAWTTPAEVRFVGRFEARAVFDAMAHATVFMGVPAMFQRLLTELDTVDGETRARWTAAAAGLRLATSGSAALPASLAERWRSITGAIPLERYGMTEIGIALSNPLDAGQRTVGAVGTPLPTVELRLVDGVGHDTAGPAELWVRGPSLFREYVGQAEATRAAFTDGWFRTGDVGVREPSGAIRLLGRASVDILKSGGEKISALEIEEVLREHPDVAEVAVVGIPDERWGDRVVAVVVPRAGREAGCTESALRVWSKERLAPFKVPRQVRVVTELPRNAMGKVLKPALVAAISREEPPTNAEKSAH